MRGAAIDKKENNLFMLLVYYLPVSQPFINIYAAGELVLLGVWTP